MILEGLYSFKTLADMVKAALDEGLKFRDQATVQGF